MTKHRNSRRTYRKGEERRIRVEGLRRDPPDVHRLSRALLARAQEMARAQAEADAAAQAGSTSEQKEADSDRA